MTSQRINLADLRAAAERRDPGDEPEGHVCMTGDYALALVEAVEAAQEFEVQLSDYIRGPKRNRLRAALAPFVAEERK